MRIIAPFAAAFAIACLLGGCVYRMPILQGNYLDPAVIAQIKPGMTHSQVRYLLGSPMIPQGFDDSRWDYDFYLKMRRLQTPKHGHVIVHFADGLVTRVESDVTSAPFAVAKTDNAMAPGLR